MSNPLIVQFLRWLFQWIVRMLLRVPGVLETTDTAVNLALPELRPGLASGYKKVHALLLSWAGGDPRMDGELEKLKDVLDAFYNFEIETFHIPHGPGIRSHHELNKHLLKFTENHSRADSLLIVYYAGHGMVDLARNSVWM